jgi:acetyltransferase-like isoleucine patch superfamily enzyme
VRGNDQGRIVIGDEVTIDTGARLAVANKAVMTIGDNAGIGPYNILNAFDDLTVGRDTMFGPFVNVNCADHGIETGTPMRLQHGTYGPVRIGRDCWLGAGVIVTKGVTIGNGAVIGAGSVVTCDVPEYTVACGAPARAVRERSDGEGGPVCGDECPS